MKDLFQTFLEAIESPIFYVPFCIMATVSLMALWHQNEANKLKGGGKVAEIETHESAVGKWMIAGCVICVAYLFFSI